MLDCRKSAVLYQELCGTQKSTGRQVGHDKDQSLCRCYNVTVMYMVFIKPRPSITHQVNSCAMSELHIMHNTVTDAWFLKSKLKAYTAHFVQVSLFCCVIV
jgi:hypothetical protein